MGEPKRETLTPGTILQLRMAALGLNVETVEDQPDLPAAAPSGAAQIGSTARRMLAVQAQDWRSARWGLGVRTPGTTASDVHEAFNDGLIVRSWPMRGTIHITAAEDIGWMQRATNRRVLSGAAKRREFLGITDLTLDTLVSTSLEALQNGNALNRDELSEIWTAAGIEWKSNWRYHLIWWMCQNGLTVLGPVSEQGEPRLVLANEWIRFPRELEGDDALQELAARYASARGAVSAQDLAWWAGLTVGEARTGLRRAAESGQLVECSAPLDEKPVALWVDPRQLDAPSQRNEERWLLLPAFDEHLLGYQNRSLQLAREHSDRIVPGRNSMFLATIVRDGRVVGTWKKGVRKDEGIVGTAFPGESLAEGRTRLQHRADVWGAFHGLGETRFGTASPSA